MTPLLGRAYGDGPKVTERAQNADFAENRRFSQIHPFSWKFQHLEGAENRRKPQETADHLRSVTFSSALPPKKGVLDIPPTVRFPPPSGVVALLFLYKNPRLSRPEALLEGSRIFHEGALSGTFSSPHTFCTPPYHGPIVEGFTARST